MKMDEQEYQDKLKVRTQLSLADKFRVLEHEFDCLCDWLKKSSPPEYWPDFLKPFPILDEKK